MNVTMFANTNGRGLWSTEMREVEISRIKIDTMYSDGDQKYFTVVIEVKFTRQTWNIEKDGLIYTDPMWLREFKLGLVELGLPRRLAGKVDYTEQGQQGKNYVSLAFDLTKLKDARAVCDFFEIKMSKFSFE